MIYFVRRGTVHDSGAHYSKQVLCGIRKLFKPFGGRGKCRSAV
jgi:hypothetical protein